MTSRVQLARRNTGVAFGETLGLDVPTRYTEDIHGAMNVVMAVDSLVTPAILGMSSKTLWLCRGLAALLFAFRGNLTDMPLRQRLEIEAATGVLLMLLAFRGTVTHRVVDNLYMFIGGAMMIGNAFMTEVSA